MRDREDYVFFWKPHDTNGWASQWTASPFAAKIMIDGEEEQAEFPSAEHWMMAQKALLFGDTAMARKIMAETGVKLNDMTEIKALGRKVSNFDDGIWKEKREDIVLEGTLLKFRQNEELRAKLLQTDDKDLVEASPRDRIWGIGFGEKNALGPTQRTRWGQNLLGKALMKAREMLREEVRNKEPDTVQPGGGSTVKE